MADRDVSITGGLASAWQRIRTLIARENILSLAVAAYFPLVLLGALGGPLLLSHQFGVPLFKAFQYSFLLAAIAYVIGIGLLWQ